MELGTVSRVLKAEEEYDFKTLEKWCERIETKWVFLRVSWILRLQPNSKAVALSVLLFFLLPFSTISPPPWCPSPASRHHGSALTDCLHADGCGDYACHFRLRSPDRWVLSLSELHRKNVQHLLEGKATRPFPCFLVPLRSVLCQHHGDCGDVCCCHSHCPSVSPSQPQQRTNATIGKNWICDHGTFSGSLMQ